MTGYKFVIYNDKYTATLTGQSVYIRDRETGDEITRFKGLRYAYRAVFNPIKNMLVVKSTEPWLYFYSLETMSLIRRIKCKKAYQVQDSGFCVSTDGKYIINIEGIVRKVTGVPRFATCLVVYSCETFEETERFFDVGQYWFRVIECHKEGYLLAGTDLLDNTSDPYFFDGKDITKTYVKDFNLDDINPYDAIYYQDKENHGE